MANNTNQPAGLLDADAAYAVVYQRVYAPRVFEKLAAVKMSPRNQEEAMQLLAMAGRLRQAYDADQEKQANAAGSFISAAATALDAKLSARGLPINPSTEQHYKMASLNGSKDPELANAILSLQFVAQQAAA